VSEDILTFATEKQVDVLLLGTNGFSGNTLGSVSDRVSNMARCTTIVVKDPRVTTSAGV
jgi:nucleotide-binding universal stress UspA family protein